MRENGSKLRYRHSRKCFFFFLNRQTGLLLLGMKENPELKTIQATLSRHGVEHQYLPFEELKQRFPNIQLARGEVGLLDKSGGVLYADKALRVLQVIQCSLRGNGAPTLGFWAPISHPPIPSWMSPFALLALALTFGAGQFYISWSAWTIWERKSRFCSLFPALNEGLFVHQGEPHI